MTTQKSGFGAKDHAFLSDDGTTATDPAREAVHEAAWDTREEGVGESAARADARVLGAMSITIRKIASKRNELE